MSLLRPGDSSRVTTIELFFDLVYVFAVTQLSHHLLGRSDVTAAAQTALLLAMVWLVWAYTAWVTNWLDPERLPVRMLLIALMLVSLFMSAGLPEAFTSRGLWVGGAYAVSQIGRSVFTLVAVRGEPLWRNFERILAWCLVSGALAVAGGLLDGGWRAGLWVAAVLVDISGSFAGFYTPGIGRSETSDWTIKGGHFAERCEAFILIVFGESLVVIGTTLSIMHHVDGAVLAAFVVDFSGVVAFWLVYFDRSAELAAEVIASASDPGRLGRSAYHLIHPVMIAGVIVAAAADDKVLSAPGSAHAATGWLILSGTGIFLAGHAAFKAAIWRVVPWTRLAGIAVLALLGLFIRHVPAVALGAVGDIVVVLVAVADRVTHRAEMVT